VNPDGFTGRESGNVRRALGSKPAKACGWKSGGQGNRLVTNNRKVITMKTIATRCLKSRIARWGLFVALAIGAAASIAWVSQKQYQLGGGWIGNNGAGNIWSALQIPLDPAGRTAALRIHLPIYNADFAELLAAVGADSASDAVGEVKTGPGALTKRPRHCGWVVGNPPPLVCAHPRFQLRFPR
jgi:hypothetical protein